MNELASDNIRYVTIPSGRTTKPLERILLINLFNLLVRALPSMPHAHVIRTLFSPDTQCLVVVARGHVVRAGLVYHELPQRGFAELIFVAVREEDRAKGYAAFLMRHLRARLRVASGINVILAYADNSARGWFKRQGFGDVTLLHEQWAGYIRDYDGAQLVQTYVHACGEEVYWKDERGEIVTMKSGEARTKLPFGADEEQWLVRNHHDVVRNEMWKRMPGMGVVYPGLEFRPGEVKHPETVPGLAGRGLARQMYAYVCCEMNVGSGELKSGCRTEQPSKKQRLRRLLSLLIDTMTADSASEPFLHPVDVTVAPGYNDIIKQPMGEILVMLFDFPGRPCLQIK